MNTRKFITIFFLAVLALGAGILISKAYMRSKSTTVVDSGNIHNPLTSSSTLETNTVDASTTTPTLKPKNIILTQSDDNTTVTLSVGDEALLKLATTSVWTISNNNPSVVSAITNVGTIEGIQGMYKAVKTGSSDITAEGRAHCNPGEMCAQYIISYKVHVIVKSQ